MVKWQTELSPKIIWPVKLEERALLQLVIIFCIYKKYSRFVLHESVFPEILYVQLITHLRSELVGDFVCKVHYSLKIRRLKLRGGKR